MFPDLRLGNPERGFFDLHYDQSSRRGPILGSRVGLTIFTWMCSRVTGNLKILYRLRRFQTYRESLR